MPRDFNTKSIFIGETHGRVTPRVEECTACSRRSTAPRPRPICGRALVETVRQRHAQRCERATGMGGNERDAHPVIRRVVIRLGGEA